MWVAAVSFKVGRPSTELGLKRMMMEKKTPPPSPLHLLSMPLVSLRVEDILFRGSFSASRVTCL